MMPVARMAVGKRGTSPVLKRSSTIGNPRQEREGGQHSRYCREARHRVMCHSGPRTVMSEPVMNTVIPEVNFPRESLPIWSQCG